MVVMRSFCCCFNFSAPAKCIEWGTYLLKLQSTADRLLKISRLQQLAYLAIPRSSLNVKSQHSSSLFRVQKFGTKIVSSTSAFCRRWDFPTGSVASLLTCLQRYNADLQKFGVPQLLTPAEAKLK